MSDEQILDLFFSRDERALEETHVCYGAQLGHLAYRILGSYEDAEEIRNETYWKAWENIPPARPSRFFVWLARVCRHLSLNEVRKQKAGKRHAALVSLTDELAGCIPDTRQSVDQDAGELAALISGFLRSQPTALRVLFIRRYWYCDSVKELADAFAISRGKVKTDLFRTRQRLREFLEKEGYTI